MPKRGDIVLVPFVYSDLAGRKRRPACVVSSDRYHRGPDVMVVMVTSQRRRLDRPGSVGMATLDQVDDGLRDVFGLE